ncbi:heparinase II/III domain-containing protein [Microvirga lotononidis]|uniref:Heparinase II/III-like protein n=1 Tax=Microvirga lotononidis TaxID=864069 RepID=I4YLV2_9HYPH|nr:heparinase II/III family protein [Microvirga lotononidis]EIM24944.1 Heparinase II/III-like protein [Microvirga lotononidis]WQO29558.1 heparinase II/III family protein [Microvirga lotononidis]
MPEVRQISLALRDQAAEGSTGDAHVVANHNRWSRIVFDIKDIAGDTWCEVGFQITWHTEEQARSVLDFASVGIDFLAEDGSNIDFAYVPGLSRTQIDPHSHYIAGPAFHDRSSDDSHSARVLFNFFVPAPARHLTLTIRSWRNSHPFTVGELSIRQNVEASLSAHEEPSASPSGDRPIATARRAWWALSMTPLWLNYGVAPGHPLLVRGQLINSGKASDGALARIIFRDAKGKQIPPPYEGVSSSPAYGPLLDIPIHRQARRFTLELTPPSGAATVELGFQVLEDESQISLVAPLEVSIGDDLLLENILEDDVTNPLSFLDKVRDRLHVHHPVESPRLRASPVDQWIDSKNLGPLLTFHDRLKAIQLEEAPAIIDGRLTLCGLEPWPLPEVIEWTEDPYKSPAWRLEFQSLSWLLDLAGRPELGGPERAVELALSWVQSNTWDEPKDALSTYPLAMATRIEVLLHLLAMVAGSKNGKDIKRRQSLFAEIIRCGFALSEIVSQNIFSPSVLQVRTACALLAVGRAIPLFPLASYWRSIARAQLRSGFEQVIGPDGSSIEQSLHERLEIISIGLLLTHSLGSEPEARDFRERLSDRLRAGLKIIVGVTDPGGMLPPIGDAPQGYHHASWLRRLISSHGRALLTDSELAEELSYPTGPRTFVSDNDGIIVFRDYERKPHWSYLCASFGEQRRENGHFNCSSFVYTARGTRWITDPGGSSLHDTGSIRHFLASSRAHNVARPDGRDQSSGRGWIEARTSLANANIVRVRTNVYGPGYDHARVFMCLDNLNAIAVFDCFRGFGRSISFEGNLHFAENVAVALANTNLAVGFHNRNRLRMIPYAVAGEYNGMAVVNGHNDRRGSLQGFVSHAQGALRPANVLTYRFSGSGHVCGGMILTVSEQGFRRIMDLVAMPDVRELLQMT